MTRSEKLKGQTERSDKELLELVLEGLGAKMNEWKCSGLCAVISIMETNKIIDSIEEHRLYEIINQNPTEYYGPSEYYFPPREVEPRIEYLKQLIEEYK